MELKNKQELFDLLEQMQKKNEDLAAQVTELTKAKDPEDKPKDPEPDPEGKPKDPEPEPEEKELDELEAFLED